MSRTFKLFVTLICISFTSALFAADSDDKVTYRWKDESGIIQYTERPPKNLAYEKITVKSGGSEEVVQVTAEQATEETSETTESALDEVIKANERNCKIANQNMQVLQEMARIRVTENGEERILSPEEKQERIAETQKQIDIYCKPM